MNTNGNATTVTFDFGLSNSYGTTFAGIPASVSSASPTPVSKTLTGLSPGTTYHFRVNGVNGFGTFNGADTTFTTVDTNATLSSLGFSAGTLAPAFSSNTWIYETTVPASAPSISLTPTLSHGTGTVMVNGVAVVSGTASSPIALGYGDNTINVVVTAQDGFTTNWYSIKVSRSLPTQIIASYNSAADVPFITNGLTATGSTANFSLNFAPAPGTTLTVVNNTSLGFINGTFSNLAQGQIVNLSYNGATYQFVANYYGGTGNDLVLIWAGTRPVAWGVNTAGELGNNSAINSSSPVSVTTAGTPLAGRTLLALSAGFEHCLALCSDGTVASWGYNSDGELGNNTTTNSSVPVAVTTAGTALAGKTVVAIGAGLGHSLALCSDGSLATWGINSFGQLGNNTTTNSRVPVGVTTTGTALAGKTVVVISAGSIHNLVLCSDGTLASWGYNQDGELGTGGFINSPVPVAVTTAGTPLAGRTVVAISAGPDHNLVLCSDGTLVTWGGNSNGQLGNNTNNPSSLPQVVPTVGTVLAGKTVIAIATGDSHSLALCSDGTLAAWGYNADGELGNNAVTDSLYPVAVNTSGVLAGKTVVGLTSGVYHSVAWCSDGAVATWGLNNGGQLGNNSTTNSSIPVMVTTSSLATGERFMQVNAGSSSAVCLGLVAAPIPAATTLAATSVTATTVVLNGQVNANSGTANVSFDYGSTTAYGTNITGSPSSVNGGSANAVSATLTGLAPGTTYHFRANGTNTSGTASGADLSFTTSLSLLQNWRQQAFGTTVNSGTSADSADYDGDGIPNLIEYALNLNPKATSKLPVSSAVKGANFEYTYSRSTAAVNAGMTYTVEWSAALPATWGSSGVTQTVLSDDGTTQQVKAVIPMNAASRMFVHLSVTSTP